MGYYVSKNPVDLSHLAQTDLKESIKASLSNSQYIYFIRVLCSYVAPENIPTWTGFNYLIHKWGYSKVIYLPTTYASPRKLDTVLEVLLHSKAKTLNMELPETHVVVDHTIYAVPTKFLKNLAHKDLKNFIMLWMGGFCITMTFLGVIGERFKDAGLKGLLVESTVFGM